MSSAVMMAPARQEAAGRPVIESYDSAYEHSVERWFETRSQVEAAFEDEPLDLGFS